MAVYRQIHISFWQDGFVLDLTPEEKYFYIYLMTNSKTTQCGIYELPKKIIETETGYNRETVDKLLQRFVDYNKIMYHEPTKEIFILNWIKHNFINSPKVKACISKELGSIKNTDFVTLFLQLCVQYGYSIDTLSIDYGEEKEKEKEEEKELITNKKKYSDYVSMTEEEYNKLIEEYGQALTDDKIEDLNNWKGSKGKKTKSDYLTIRAWIRKDEKEGKNGKPKASNEPKRNFGF